ncbi:type II CAAX endopeptidase family protein [Polyangium jinanense]|uniref:CPBP family intramembrane metalloprotease n=1 Tax=Polyangium jinanense TaxID=2829994 RepID=A0A9X3X5F3_9BACT|nr:type II CAAX endopeptidase family protein [Polyangium jinanense]MDC3961294.1 CPBP family intramembrane metalloprotease [Polyangium jinanense]MDC3984074.1 CPBP family intramembrane metalloprotease [Polyangium jinanense]
MHEAMDKVRRARRGLAIYFGVLLLASAPFQVDIALHGLAPSRFLPFVWVPCLASVVARFVLREGFGDVSFRFDRRVAWSMVPALIYPVVIALPAYGLAWGTGIAAFEPAAVHPLGFPIPGGTPGERFVAGCIIALTIGPAAMAVLAIGEEIGWRGYLLPRLIDAGVPYPALVTGVVWGLWHAPLILSGHYNPSPSPLLALLLFVVSMCGQSYFAARLRLDTGSVWPPVVMHAAWNAIVVSFFGASTTGEHAPLWASEGGVLVAASTVLITFLLLRFRRGQESAPSSRSSALGTVRL